MSATTADKVLDALRPYGLRRESGGEWRANSPLRPGANAHSFKLKIEDGEHGAYYDHVTGEEGSLYALAERLGIETPQRAAVADTKRAYRDLADYAAAHGMDADTMRAGGWGDVTTVQGRPALPFKTATGTRYRFVDGEKPVYKSDTGYKACWYGLARALKLREGTDKPLVLCNGEASTLAAQHAGIPAACVTSGEKRLPDDLLASLKASYSGKVLLAFDCDDTGRRVAQEVRAQLDGMDAVAVDLGLSDKGDLADFCMLHGDGALDALLRLTPAPAPPITVSVGADLQALMQATNALKDAIRKDPTTGKQVELETLLAQLQGELDRVSMAMAAPLVQSFAEIAADAETALDVALAHPDPVQGLRSKIPSLDAAIGGFTPEVYVIYGASSMGKSTLAVSLCREFVKQGAGLIATTESHPRRWFNKLVASLTNIPSDLIDTGQLDSHQQMRVRSTYGMLSELNCHMLNSGSPTPSQLRAAVLKGMEKFSYQWVIVDSASKMNFPGATSIYDITRGVSNGIQSLMQEASIPIVVTSQVGRDVSERPKGQKMPQLDDGYGGGTIEHNAGVVLGLYNHAYYVEVGREEPDDVRFPPNTALVRLLKNRWRGGARTSAVMLRFVGGAGFYELETRRVDLSADALANAFGERVR